MSPVDKARHDTPDGCVRFWDASNYAGRHWDYNPASGYKDVPVEMHDHAHSFYSKAHRAVHAVNWFGEGHKETRVIHHGDHRWNWDFGEKLDAVQPG
jgi:hypothetical protein